ncbi:phage tail tape measure protein [Gallintestinimicrobium sp.]|uniref:phage tail tape measure protein n=1 Tax=Gallintestinimicrobium sp. TaxID=2981655 RepID=UPI00399A94B1
MVKKNLGDLSDTDLTNLTQQALTLDQLYGIDMNETLRGVNALMKQYGLTAQETMDYIVKGTQNGLDKTNELGDNLSEYSGKFAQAGYSASEYFQALGERACGRRI